MADTPLTISGRRVSKLLNQEGAIGENTIKFKVNYADIAYGSGNADTVTLTLGNTPANWAVTNAKVNITTAFAGTTAMTIIVGTTTSTAAFVSSTSILTAATLPAVTTLASLTNATGTAAKSLVAIFTNATGGSPSALTAGELDIYLNLIDTSAALG
jgi:hypothetical protein